MGEVFGIAGKQAGSVFQQQNARLAGIDEAKIADHDVPCNLSNSAGQFHPGGTAAHDDEIERIVFPIDRRLTLGLLESHENAAANLDGIFHGLQTRREALPLRM